MLHTELQSTQILLTLRIVLFNWEEQLNIPKTKQHIRKTGITVLVRQKKEHSQKLSSENWSTDYGNRGRKESRKLWCLQWETDMKVTVVCLLGTWDRKTGKETKLSVNFEIWKLKLLLQCSTCLTTMSHYSSHYFISLTLEALKN